MTNQKVAIGAGGSSGIGRVAFIALAKEGAKIVVAARRAKEGEETVNHVREAGCDGTFVKTDVADEASVRSLVEKTVRSYGRLDYAFNNAGVEQTMTLLAKQTVEEFHHHEHKCQGCMVVHEI
jgi:NAD(P)-dependent dehydrogenase (short-subunit alcohol dehydrogenase family)